MASRISIIVSASAARAMAAFAALRAGFSRLGALARAAATRMRTAFASAASGAASFARRGFSVVGAFFRSMPAVAAAAVRGVVGFFRSMGTSIGSIISRIRSSFSSIASGPGGAAGGGAGGATGAAAGFTGVVSMLGVIPQMAIYGAAIVHLTALIGNLLPLVQLVAPAAIAAGAGMVTFKFAMNGVADALKAGMDGDIEKLNEALKKLSPSAKSAVLTLLDLRKEWGRTQKAVQESFWKGARDDLIRVSRAIQPIADRWLPKLAAAFSNVRTMIANVLEQSAKTGQLDKIMEGVHRFFTGLVNTIPYLIRAFLDIAEVASPSLGEIGDGIEGAAKKFSDWIRTLKEDGTLKRWLDRAKEIFGQLKDIAKEAGRVIRGIFSAGEDDSDDFLEGIRNSLSELADWVESEEGQQFLNGLAQVGIALANIIVWIASVAAAISNAWDWVSERTARLRDRITEAWNWVSQVVRYATAVIASVPSAFGWIENVIGRIGNIISQVSRLSSAIRNIPSIPDIGGAVGRLFGRATGGAASGLTWVGERGRELVDFGQGRVYNHGQSERMAASAGGGGSFSITFGTPAVGDHLANAMLELVRTGRIPLIVTSSGRVKTA